jgi:hypothetical protein
MAASYSVRLTQPNFVGRATKVRIPGTASLSLIPSAFDLAAFEEFAPRTAGLRKWTLDPSLLVLASVVDYPTAQASFTDFRVTDRGAATSTVDCILTEMNRSLAQMTGAQLTFKSQEIITAPPGSRFKVTDIATGSIVVLLARSLGANGRGMAYTGQDLWTFNRGVVFLHADDLPPCSPTAARVIPHELGHALGYAWNHVSKQPSIMGSPPFPMTQFDQDAIAVINQRPPGNKAPDSDPDDFSSNLLDDLRALSTEPVP